MADNFRNNLYVNKLTAEQVSVLKELLAARNWQLTSAPHAYWKAVKDKTNITAYKSGKLVVQGKGTADVVRYVIEPEVLKEARYGYEKEWARRESPEMFQPHIGIDESGKGDFFGPLVIAGVYVDEQTAENLFDAGVTDSKKIGSDKRICELADKIRGVVKGRFSVVTIGPASYNRLYENMQNLNKILAWGHARVLENIIDKGIDCSRAVSDQFADERVVQRALMEKGRSIKLEQYPRAEKDVAVAAASIVARAGFLDGLDKLADRAALEAIPKGAGPKVKEVAIDIAENLGEDALPEFVKMHFKTLNAVTDILHGKQDSASAPSHRP